MHNHLHMATDMAKPQILIKSVMGSCLPVRQGSEHTQGCYGTPYTVPCTIHVPNAHRKAAQRRRRLHQYTTSQTRRGILSLHLPQLSLRPSDGKHERCRDSDESSSFETNRKRHENT